MCIRAASAIQETLEWMNAYLSKALFERSRICSLGVLTKVPANRREKRKFSRTRVVMFCPKIGSKSCGVMAVIPLVVHSTASPEQKRKLRKMAMYCFCC